MEEELLLDIGEINARLAPGEIGPVGAVIGPTHIDPALDLVSPQGIYLAPGVGAQGATPQDVALVFAACPERVIPSASRSLLGTGPDVVGSENAPRHWHGNSERCFGLRKYHWVGKIDSSET